jgi:hypothetical protein
MFTAKHVPRVVQGIVIVKEQLGNIGVSDLFKFRLLGF